MNHGNREQNTYSCVKRLAVFLFLSPLLVALDLVVIVIKENISSACGQTETKWYSAAMLYY